MRSRKNLPIIVALALALFLTPALTAQTASPNVSNVSSFADSQNQCEKITPTAISKNSVELKVTMVEAIPVPETADNKLWQAALADLSQLNALTSILACKYSAKLQYSPEYRKIKEITGRLPHHSQAGSELRSLTGLFRVFGFKRKTTSAMAAALAASSPNPGMVDRLVLMSHLTVLLSNRLRAPDYSYKEDPAKDPELKKGVTKYVEHLLAFDPNPPALHLNPKVASRALR